MTEKELIETLRNFTEKQVNDLPDKAKIVFYAIMNIADQRDELKGKINKAIGHINVCGLELNKDQCRYLLEILKGDNK